MKLSDMISVQLTYTRRRQHTICVGTFKSWDSEAMKG